MATRDRVGSKWVSTTRVASELGVDRRTVARWAAREQIPAQRVGRGQFRIERDWFDQTKPQEKATPQQLSLAVQPVRRPGR